MVLPSVTPESPRGIVYLVVAVPFTIFTLSMLPFLSLSVIPFTLKYTNSSLYLVRLVDFLSFVVSYTLAVSRDISVKTLINYNDNIQKSMIISKCKREDIIGKKKLKFLEKYYVVDLGFYTLLNENKRNYGQILETIVYNELRRRGYAVTVGEVNNLEVDFIARKFKKKIYVQVSTSLQDDKTREREFKPLKKIKDNFQKYIISNDTFDFSEDGIIHLNIKEFLKKETF